MAFKHGRNARFDLDDSTNTLRNISTYLEDVTFSPSADTAETSAIGSTAKTYVAGLTDGTISLSGMFDPTADGYLQGILGNDSITGGGLPDWEYHPHGTGSGNIKYSGKGILTSYEVSAGVGDMVSFTAEIQISGAVTRAVL